MGLAPILQNLGQLSSFLAAIGLIRPFKEIGALLTDQIKLWRVENQIAILEKANLFCQKKGVTPKIIPRSFLAPLLEAAQNEDNENLQKKWAALLGNASMGSPVHPAYINLIKDLSAAEAIILDTLYETVDGKSGKIKKSEYEKIIDDTLSAIKLNEAIKLTKSIVMNNLMRLDLVALTQSKAHTVEPNSQAYLSEFSIDFIKSCKFD